MLGIPVNCSTPVMRDVMHSNIKPIISSTLSAIALYILYIDFIYPEIKSNYPWGLSLAFTLIFISQLIDDPGLGTKPIKFKRLFVVLLVLILALTVFVQFDSHIEYLKENTVFQFILIIILVLAWVYDTHKRMKKHNNA